MTKLGLTPRSPDNLALLSLCHATPRWLRAVGGWKGPRGHSFIQIRPPKCSTPGPGKWRRLGPERWCGPSPRNPGPLFPRRAGAELALKPRRTRIRLRARPPTPAPGLPGPPLPPLWPPAPDLRARPLRGHRGRNVGVRLLLLPPAPRAEAVARETGRAVREGARPFPRPVHLRCPAVAAPRSG